MRKNRQRILCFTVVGLIVYCVSFIFSPPKPAQQLLVSDPNAIVRWDTGYGFNDFQIEKMKAEQSPIVVNGLTFYSPLRGFGRFQWPEQIKIDSSAPLLSAVIYHDGIFDNLALTKVETASQVSYVSEKLSAEGDRNLKQSLFFICGLLLVTAVFSGIILLLVEQMSPFYFGLTGLYFAMLFSSIPFLRNRFNAFDSIHGIEIYRFVPQDSLLLQNIWAALYEVFASVDFINFMQLSAFFLVMLRIASLLKKLHYSGFATGAIALLTLFSPLALVYGAYLERAITSGYINSALMMFAAVYLWRKAPLSMLEWFTFLLGVALSAGTRLDNIPFALALAAAVSTLVPGILKFFFLYLSVVTSLFCAFGLDQINLSSNHTPRYAVISTINTFADFLRSEGGDKILNENDLQTVEKVLDLKVLRQGNPFEEIPLFTSLSLSEPEDYRNYLNIYWRLVQENPVMFLRSRWNIFCRAVTTAPMLWLFDELDTKSYPMAGLLDLRYLEKWRVLNTPPEGLARAKSFFSRFEDSTSNIPQLCLLLLAILLLPWLPVSGVISICLLTRVLAVFAMAPNASFFYLYDLYLIGPFLLFGLIYEYKRKNLKAKFVLQKSAAASSSDKT